MYTFAFSIYAVIVSQYILKVYGDCPPLLPKKDQFLRVICYGSVACDKPGVKVPPGARAILKCLDNYEPESTTQQQVTLTCLADSKWVGLVEVEQLWCKAKCGKPVIQDSRKVRSESEHASLKWPWFAAIFLNNAYHCGGTIINPTKDVFLILTTSDCLSLPDGTPIDVHQFKIGVGIVTNPSASLGANNVKQILNIKHVLVDEDGVTGGVALVYADTRIKLSDNVQPICMPDNDVFFSSDHISGEVAGLGRISTGNGRNWSSDTRIISMPLTTQTNCTPDTDVNLRDFPGPKYCVRIRDGQFECSGGGGYGFVTKESDPTRYTLQGVMGSASTNYICSGLTNITPLFPTMAWIRQKAAMFIRRDSSDDDNQDDSTDKVSNSGDPETNSNQTGNIITYVAVGAIVVGILAVGYSCRSHFYGERYFTNEEMDAFFKGVQSSVLATLNVNSENTAYECLPYDNTYEIKDSEFSLNNSHILGSGTYGIVFKGTYKGNLVAVKTVKAGADKAYLLALLSELKVMIHLGKHPHLVSLLGAKTRYLQRGILYILVELCQMGSLAGYLVKYHNVYGEECGNSSAELEVQGSTGHNAYQNIPMLSRGQLLKWAFEICLAMEFLENKKVIHGDLAARNVLLTENLTVKVSDFGLSRKLYEYTTYVKKHQEPLPWRWMATESLQRLEFSTKSDVWSFGITLWEIFTLGDVPYPGLSYTIDFPVKLSEGLRLYAPPLAPEEIYDLMQNCWQQKPEDRPGFRTLKIKLHTTLMATDSLIGEEYTDLD